MSSIPRMFEHSPEMRSVVSRTDCSLDDEAAGRARLEFREASEKRRAEEQARIKEANRKNKERLANIKAKTDDGDGLEGGGSPNMTNSFGFSSQVSLASTASSAVSQRLDGLRSFSERAANVYLDKGWDDHAQHLERLANARVAPREPRRLVDQLGGERRRRGLVLERIAAARAALARVGGEEVQLEQRERAAAPPAEERAQRGGVEAVAPDGELAQGARAAEDVEERAEHAGRRARAVAGEVAQRERLAPRDGEQERGQLVGAGVSMRVAAEVERGVARDMAGLDLTWKWDHQPALTQWPVHLVHGRFGFLGARPSLDQFS